MVRAMSDGSPVRARAGDLLGRIHELANRSTSLMEVCGTHTMAIGRAGLRSRLPSLLRLISGPGCPVCVTPAADVDRIVAMAGEPGVTVTTFGDMVRVPGSRSSLEQARALGADIRIVYSAADALEIARREPARLVVFMGVGFETTSPTVAATLEIAARTDVSNFYVLPSFKLVPPAMAALVEAGESRIDGFICPGHVSAIIGSAPYAPIADDRSTPCVIAGFEPLDILRAVVMLLEQRATGRSRVEIQYTRAVRPEGNPTALEILSRVFRPCDAAWRGIGAIPRSGLELAPDWVRFDARTRIGVEIEPAPDLPVGCSCGQVMRGLVVPDECPLFGRACTPAHPVGPCMVSSEGACAAYHLYGAGR